MGAQVSVIHSDLMAKAARTNYAGAGGTKVSIYIYTHNIIAEMPLLTHN